nr:hypothetical protein [Brachybacterium massiliense]
MPVEMGIWRIDGEVPRRLTASRLPSEATLENFLEQDPALLGTKLLVIGRQVRTPYGKFLDLLAIDADGNLHVLELKRDRTPREVVAQVLDYGSWVSTLGRDEIIDLANTHLDEPFASVFDETFGDTLPDELNKDLELTIVATELDASLERIVTYLRGLGVPVNAVFFSYLEDGDRRYLARSWLAPQREGAESPKPSAPRSKRAEWNGRDWFIAFGEESGSRSWQDARRFSFVSAGGGHWYSRTLRSVPVGARVNVHVPKAGYVGVGTTTGEAMRFDKALVGPDDKLGRLADQALEGRYHHGPEGAPQDDDVAEWVLPVQWDVTVPVQEAFWEKGMFANQNSACSLRDEFTLERIAQHFGLED